MNPLVQPTRMKPRAADQVRSVMTVRTSSKKEATEQSARNDWGSLSRLLLSVVSVHRVTRLGLASATRAVTRQLLLFALAAPGLAAGQTTGVSFPNAVLSSNESSREISGLLAKPEGAGPFPAVVLLHTCGGIKPHVSNDWPAYLNGLGYVTLTVDTFGSRGLGPCGNALHPSGPGPKTEACHEFTRDAYGAFDYLARRPYVRPDQIAVIGFSLGANAINSYLIHRPRSSSGNFTAAVGVYGRCHDLWGYRPGSTPLMELAGELDTHHVGACRAVSPPIEVHILPGAHHSWDSPQASGRTAGRDFMLYDSNATEKSRELVKNFLSRHLGK